MNRTSIDWAQFSWNPVTGCTHGCDYCYARRIAQRFTPKETDNWDDCTQPGNGLHEIRHMAGNGGAWRYGFAPTLHSYRLSEPLWVKKPSRIFVCSMADLFGDWVPQDWITQVLAACDAAPQHQYLFLTKNPMRYRCLVPVFDKYLPPSLKWGARPNWWLGATFDTAVNTSTFCRHLAEIKARGYHTWASAEPLLEDITSSVDWASIDWLVIGAMTGPGSKNRQPEADWVYNLTAHAIVHHVPVFQKQSLKQFHPLRDLTQEYPKAMTKEARP